MTKTIYNVPADQFLTRRMLATEVYESMSRCTAPGKEDKMPALLTMHPELWMQLLMDDDSRHQSDIPFYHDRREFRSIPVLLDRHMDSKQVEMAWAD